MKAAIGCLLILGLTACSGASVRQADGTYEIETKIDEYTGVTSKRVEIPIQQGGFYHFKRQIWVSDYDSPEMQEARSKLGRPLTEDEELVGVTFYRTGESWAYLKCNHVHFLADGERLSPDTDHDGSIHSGSVAEYVSMTIPKAYLRKLASSAEAKVRICDDETVFSDGVKQTFAKFIGPEPPKRETCLSLQSDYQACLDRGGYDPTTPAGQTSD